MKSPIGCLEHYLRSAFSLLALCIARKPIPFLVVPVLVTVPFCFGGFFIRFNNDMVTLFTPLDGESKTEKLNFEATFGSSQDADSLRSLQLPNFGEVIVVAEGDDNILEEKLLERVIALDNAIRNTDLKIGLNLTASYRSLCKKSHDGKCSENLLLSLIDKIGRTDNLRIKYPLHEMPGPDSRVFKINIGRLLGKVSFTDESYISTAKMFRLEYFLNSNNSETVNKEWEKSFIAYMENIHSNRKILYPGLDMTWIISSTTELELQKTIEEVTSFFVWLFLLMIATSILCCGMRDWVLSKPWLGVAGLVSCTMAICSSHGFLMYVGVDFISITTIAPFLVLAIGVDDMFVLLAAWRQTDPRDTVPERMRQTYSDAAVSITITTVTDAVGFLIGGAASVYPSVQIFCTYMGIAVLCDLIYQITFFGACMVLTGRREDNNIHPLFCMRVMSVSQADEKSWWYRTFVAGGFSFKSPNSQSRPSSLPKTPSQERLEIERKTHGGVVFFRDYYAPLLFKWPVKAITVVLYIVYLAFAIEGCAELQEGLQLKHLYNEGSYALDHHDNTVQYFNNYSLYVSLMFNSKSTEYLSQQFFDTANELIDLYKDTGYFHGRDFAISCIGEFHSYYERAVTNATNKTDDMLRMLATFMQTQRALDMNCMKDIIMDERNRITATRLFIQSKDLQNSQRQMEMMLKSRELVSLPKYRVYNITSYSPWFVFYDQYATIIPNTLFNLFYTIVSMLFVSLLLIPSPIVCVWVLIAVVSICTGMIGFMAYWKVNMDSVAMINVIMSVCFSVDFSAHIAYTFTLCEADDVDNRMKIVLSRVGVPITMSSVSTLVGVALLYLSSAYVVQVFFKIMFLVIIFGTFHGLLVMPILLNLTYTLFSRKKKSDAANQDDNPLQLTQSRDETNSKNNEGKSNLVQSHEQAEADTKKQSDKNVVEDNDRTSKVDQPDEPRMSDGLFLVQPCKDISKQDIPSN